jgi:hypothetical protein
MTSRNNVRFFACLLCVILLLSGCGSQTAPADTAPPAETTGEAPSPAENEPATETPAEPAPETAVPLQLAGPGNTPSNLLQDGIAAEYDGYIYHTDRMMQGNLWRTLIGGGESELIQEGTFSCINANGGVLFALGGVYDPETGFDVDGIYRMNPDGSELELVREGWFDELVLYDEYLYYSDSVEGELKRIRYDGSDETLLMDNFYYDFVILGGSLYVCAELGEQYIENVYKMPLDGNGEPEMVISDIFGGGIAVIL